MSGGRYLDNWLKAYLQYTRNLEAPESFHFWAGVSAIAGALRGKCWIDMGFFNWKPNFFIIYVARPGVLQKSTTMDVAIDFLRGIEGIHFGPTSITWQRLTEKMGEAQEQFELPSGEHYITSSITVAARELGTFLDPQNRELIDVLVDLWDGKDVPWVRGTKGEGDVAIHNPWINLIGATTPGWISQNMPEYVIGGGFASRTIFIYGEKKRNFVAYPKDHLTKEDIQLKNHLQADIQKIALLSGPFNLDSEATKWGEDWYKSHWTSTPKHLRGERMGGYLARKQTHIHKLAMVIRSAQDDSMIINKEDLETSEALVSALEADMAKVFSHVTDSEAGKNLKTMIGFLKYGPLSKEELWRNCMLSMSFQEFMHALEGAQRAGHISIKKRGDSLMVEAKEE